MSPLTVFLGRVFGLACLVMYAVLFARPQLARPGASLAAIASMQESPGLMLLTGIITMIGGVAAVVGHSHSRGP